MSNDKNNPEDLPLDHDVIEDLDPVDDSPVPPRIAPPKLGASSANPIHSVLTADDVDFISKVFAQVRHVDFRAPVPEGNPRLTGIDKKLFGLREQVRKLERDLAHVSHIWGQKQQEIDTAAEWVRSKDEELIRAKGHLEDASDKLSKVEEELVELRASSSQERETLESQSADQAEEISSLKLRILSVQEELDAEREDWALRIESAREDADRKVEQAADENQRSQRAYDALKGLSQSEKEAHSLQQQNLRMQIADLGERLIQSEIAELDAQRKNVELGAQISQKAAELEANSKSVALLKIQLDDLEATSKSKLDQGAVVEKDLRAQLSELESKVTVLNESTGSVDKSMQQLNARLQEAMQAQESVETERDQLSSRLDTLAEQHDTELQRQRSAHEHLRQQHQKDLLAAENIKAQVQAELAAIRVELATSSSRVNELEQTSAEQAAKTLELERKLQDESELNRANLDTIQMLQMKLRNANQSLNESESGFVELKARLATSESDKNALAKRLLDLES